MKNKIVTIILGVCLIVSLAGNVYLFNNVTKNKDAVSAFSNQLVTAEGQISGLEEEISTLQQQLAESEDIIASLEEEKENSGIISNMSSGELSEPNEHDKALIEHDSSEILPEVPPLSEEEAEQLFEQMLSELNDPELEALLREQREMYKQMEVMEGDPSQLGEGGSGIGDDWIVH